MAPNQAEKVCTKEVGSLNRSWRVLLNASAESQSFLPFVEDFFKNKDASLDSATLRSNAECIGKAFPYYSVDYIAERLRVLGNEENSVSIVLRQLLAKQGKSNTSREANLKNLEKYCTEEAYAKGENGHNNFTELDMFLSNQNGEDNLNKLVKNILERTKDNKSTVENTLSTSKDDLEKCSSETNSKLNGDDGSFDNFAGLDVLFTNWDEEVASNKPVTISEKCEKAEGNIRAADIENRPSTSKDCTINKPCTSNKSSTSNLYAEDEAALMEMLNDDDMYEIPDSPSMDQNVEIVVRSSSADYPNEVDTVKITIDEVVRSSYDDLTAKGPYADAYMPFAERQNDFHTDQDNFRRGAVRKLNSSKPKYVTRVTVGEGRSSNPVRMENIDLIAYLKELFPAKSEQDVYVSCVRNNINVNAMPQDSDFELLVRDLSSDEPSDLPPKKADDPEEGEAAASEERVPVSDGGGGNNEKDGVAEEPPAAKRVKTNDGDDRPSDFRFRIVRVNDTHERRFVQIPHADENALSDSGDSYDEPEEPGMDVDAEDHAGFDTPQTSYGSKLLSRILNDYPDVGLEENAEPDVPQASYDNKLLSKIMEIFPDACPIYIRRLCAGKTYSHEAIDELTNYIFSITDYPKRRRKSPSPESDWDPEKQLSILKEILPDADPTYLQYQVELYLNDQDKLKNFISHAIEEKNYPTMKEYLRKQQISAQTKQYTTEFDVEKFLEVIPDPMAYFNDPQRKPTVSNNFTDMTFHYAVKFLKNTYLTLPIRVINSVFVKYNFNLIRASKDLDKIVQSGSGLMKTKRKQLLITDTVHNIPFLQVIAFLQHKKEIQEYLKMKEQRRNEEKYHAREKGLLQTCNCCYDDEVMPNCIMTCENGCSFCKTCIQKSVEIAFGENKLDFPCLGDCDSHFSLQTLQSVLSPKLFSKMAQKKQLEEVKAAGIEDLETCPFCDFATIPATGDKLFRCLNPECMKESCRECKEPSHIPLRCDEIEKDDDVKRRVYIENKMTEALLRKCYKCGLKFIKSDGCNRMTCSCGASMCYICGEPVKDYTHFNGQGGNQFHLCPLYSDTTQLHQQEVLRGAEEAKQEVGVNRDPSKLKIDPAADLQRHYEKERARNPYQLPPGMNAGNPPPHPVRQEIGPDGGFYFHVGVRVNQNRVHFRHHHHHHHHNHHQPHERHEYM